MPVTSASTAVTVHRMTVLADDGARIAAWVHEPAGAGAPDAPTVVLAHGWTLDHRSWGRVVDRLQQQVPVRVVTYDQRAHGESSARGRRRRRTSTIRTLGDDLAAVVRATAPTGPLVLGGHSMGGMTVLALAGRHPPLVRQRVRGVALVSTSCGDLAGLGRRGEGAVMRLLARVPVARAGRFVTVEGQRRLLFGEGAALADVAEVRDMIAGTRLATVGWFHGARLAYDESASVAALADVPVRVLVGDRDRLTPVRHARRIAELAPHAVLDIRPGLGHMLGYEATDVVVDHLRALVEGAA